MNRITAIVLMVSVVALAGYLPSSPQRPFIGPYKNIVNEGRIHTNDLDVAGNPFTGDHVVTLTQGMNADDLHYHNVYGATNAVFLTDDRGPGWWTVGSDVFSASLTYSARTLEKVQVNGYSWPLVADGNHIEYQYRDDDSTMLAGFTLRRSTAMTAMSANNNRVEWFYLSNEFSPDADVANGLWPVRGEPVGAVLNGVGL